MTVACREKDNKTHEINKRIATSLGHINQSIPSESTLKLAHFKEFRPCEHTHTHTNEKSYKLLSNIKIGMKENLCDKNCQWLTQRNHNKDDDDKVECLLEIRNLVYFCCVLTRISVRFLFHSNPLDSSF